MRNPVICATCNTACYSIRDVPECHECQNRRQAGEFYSPAILSPLDGAWVPKGGVLVWQPRTPKKPAPKPKPQKVEPEQETPMKRRRALIASCGTDGGYHRHIRRTKTPPCDACKAAHSEYEWDRQQRARKAVA